VDYAALIHTAAETRISGWDFSSLAGRFTENTTSWSYRNLLLPHLTSASTVLDMGTGGGEFLASLPHVGAGTGARIVATEGYPPNLPVARERLSPLGIDVVDVDPVDEHDLPFPDNSFDLVLNRHESFAPREVARVLRPGGLFITQQVGGDNLCELNEALGAPRHPYASWRLDTAASLLAAVGMEIIDQREEWPVGEFLDVGAVALYLRMAPWQIPDFSIDGYDETLRALHRRISADGSFQVRHHRFFVMCQAPDPA
jgi:SAM-dependent methyltransferase